MESIELGKLAAQAANDKKASHIVLLDLRTHSDICEFMLVCSGSNDRQTKAIADGIEEQTKAKFNLKPLAVEGKQNGQWVLLDYGALIVHIFFEGIRDYYAIEKLWPNASNVQLKLT